jgi:hypothetical protein
MPEYLTGLAAWLQGLFTTRAAELAWSLGFIQRQRRLTGDRFCQTLVFQWMADGKATLEAMAEELGVSPEALRQRLGPKARAFLQGLLVEALSRALQSRRAPLGLLDRFTAVVAEDTTVLALPAELADAFPGCGGGSAAQEGAAALKVLLRWDVRSGAIRELSVHAGRTSDQTLAGGAAAVPAGGLHLADQGFFDTERWKAFSPRQCWISRGPAGPRVRPGRVWQALDALLAAVGGDVFDGPVGLVAKTDLPCRLVARRCPTEPGLPS